MINQNPTKNQKQLLPILKIFSDNFYLVGRTAIALYLGHRQSIDFDLFSEKLLNINEIKIKIKKLFLIDQVIY